MPHAATWGRLLAHHLAAALEQVMGAFLQSLDAGREEVLYLDGKTLRGMILAGAQGRICWQSKSKRVIG